MIREMKVTKSIKAMLLVSMIIIVAVFTLTSCGGSKTLEEYLEKNPTAQDEMDAVGTTIGEQMGIDVTIDVNENDIVYTYVLDTLPSGEDANNAKANMKLTFEKLKPTMETTIKTLEDEIKIDGITMTMKYVDGNGEVFYTYTFE